MIAPPPHQLGALLQRIEQAIQKVERSHRPGKDEILAHLADLHQEGKRLNATPTTTRQQIEHYANRVADMLALLAGAGLISLDQLRGGQA